MMADSKDKSQQGKQDVAGQGGGQNQQGGRSGSTSDQAAQAAGGDGSRQSNFLHSSPEAQVFPAGKPQADNSGKRGGDSAAGTPDEGRMGGSGGTSAAGTTGNDPDR
jgi:hypothetical protein